MKIGLKTQLKMGHQLVMTPQLQKAIKLLQLSRFELEQMIQQSLVENPVLEIKNERKNEETEAFANSDVLPKETQENFSSSNYEEEQGMSMNGGGKIQEGYSDDGEETKSFESYTEIPENLVQHIEWQISVGPFSTEERSLAFYLLGFLNDQGYLTLSVEEALEEKDVYAALEKIFERTQPLASLPAFDPISFHKKYHDPKPKDAKTAAQVAEEDEAESEQSLLAETPAADKPKGTAPSKAEFFHPLNLDKTSLENAARLLESLLARLRLLDPVGVFSRDLQECLLEQAKTEFVPEDLSFRILKNHFPLFLKQDFLKLARLEKVTLEDVLAAKDQISSLEPNPGRNFNTEPVQVVIPDVYVFKMGSGYKVRLNKDNLPELKINLYYQSLSDKMQKDYGKQKNKSDDMNVLTSQYLVEKIRAGEWLIKSIEQRQKTIIKVAESIVKRQQDFLEKGIEALKPMVLKDVAEDIGVHESTVSRITTQKYMHTPQGIFELKYFFTSGIQQEDGAFISSKKIKDLIQKMVAEENPKKPLTDSQIASVLDKNMEIKVARRTVAKYREALNIEPSNRRKRRF